MPSCSASLACRALGIIGSGIATTLSQTLMFLILLGVSFVEPRLERIRPFALPWRPPGASSRRYGGLACRWAR